MKGMKWPKLECVTVLKKFSSRDKVVTTLKAWEVWIVVVGKLGLGLTEERVVEVV
ncbi:hypothetical protein Hanom_Chr06g00572081 [Helianthus anomalus]